MATEIISHGFVPDAMYGIDYEPQLSECKGIKEYNISGQKPNIRELLSTNHNNYSYLVPEVIAERVYEAAFPHLFARQLLDLVTFKGTTYTLQKGTEDSIRAYIIDEYGEIPITSERYSEETVTPEKYGVHIKLTTEAEEDSRIAIFPRHIRLAGEAMAKLENTQIYDVIKTDGTAYAGVTPISMRQILEMMTAINTADWDSDTILMHPYQYRDLMLTQEWKDAANRWQTNSSIVEQHLRGEKFKLWGTLNVIVSSAATAGTVVVMDRKVAGIIAQNRAITAKRYDEPKRDAKGYLVTQRLKAKLIWTDAVQVGTGFGTT